MYDELVKRLRESADWADHFAVLMGRDEDVSSSIKREAADAIEELNKQLKEYHKYDSFLAVHGCFDDKN